MPQENDRVYAEKIGVSLYPLHVKLITQFADESHRTFSNAVQFIIEDWARQKRAAIHAASQPESAQ